MKIHTILPDQLYQRGEIRHRPQQDKYNSLRTHHITQIIDLYGKPDLLLPPDIEYRHHPISDGTRLHPDPLLVLAARAAAHIRNAGRVLTLCHAGRNRSGLMSALIVRHMLGVSGSDAIHVVRQGRPNAIANPTFITYLESLPKGELV